jgi:hypothetical protein
MYWCWRGVGTESQAVFLMDKHLALESLLFSSGVADQAHGADSVLIPVLWVWSRWWAVLHWSSNGCQI